MTTTRHFREQVQAASAEVHSQLRALGDSTAARLRAVDEAVACKAEMKLVASKAEAVDLAKSLRSLNESMQDREEVYKKLLECNADVNSVPTHQQGPRGFEAGRGVES